MKSIKEAYENDFSSPERMLLPKGFMEHMPFKQVSSKQLVELKKHTDYNPTDYYPKGLKPRKNEVGHDQIYRFILGPTNHAE